MKTICNKKELRKQAIEIRNSMAFSGATNINSSLIVSKILNSDEFKGAKHVALYSPIKNEIDITSITKVSDKTFYFPRCNNLDLEFCEYLGENSLKIASYGIKEPIGKSVNPEILDIIYIPALMANKNNFRLGYGKGFYDRFFKKNNIKAKKIIVLSSELISDNFIEEEFDIQCDYILCEK
ncbi:MAG: 5-formyltetrahydrofolate cyclo-ligase [Candidatus Gastranaerophilales bacterium]|nr:5-formyltetrahydrofolate cyclo-ligase [Candidatus Gastranaerophilales bacterium]